MLTRVKTVAAAMALALAAAAAPATARDLTVVGWGGAGQAASEKIYFTPFTEQTGIKLQQDSWGGGYGIIKSKVETGDINWDVVQVEADEMELGCADGVYETLDWDLIGTYNTFVPGAATDCGAGVNIWGFALAYDADNPALKAEPQGWADLWDTEKFPGKRGLRKGAKAALEIALLADGVPHGQVYKVLSTPEGVDRAFAKLDEIKKDIIWWESGAQMLQLIASREVVLSSAYNSHVVQYAQSENRNFKVNYNGALMTSDYWVILKGTPHRDDAMKLVAFMSQPENMAKLPVNLPHGVPNVEAMKLVPADLASTLVSSPENLAKTVQIDPHFWIDNIEALSTRFNAWLAQ